MIVLRAFSEEDVPVLKQNMLRDKSDAEIRGVLQEWQTLCFGGKYFEMLAIVDGDCVVGSISLYQHNQYIISAGSEVFLPYRRRGYAFEAMKQALLHAKDLGYRIATAQIRKNNPASIKLHEKLGFVLDCETVNKRGNEVFIYVKLL